MIGAIFNKTTLMIVVLLLVFVLGFYSRGVYERSKKVKELEDVIKAVKKEDIKRLEADHELHEQLGTDKEKAKEIAKRVNNEVVKVIYRDCVLPAGGLQAINDTANLYSTR